MINYKKYINLQYKVRGRGPVYYDCYGLIVKIYNEVLNIDLPLFLEIPYNDKWYNSGSNYIIDNIDNNWCIIDNNIKIHDLFILYNGKTDTPNHVALWIGNNKILHIYENITSRIDRYSGYWESRLHCILRWSNNG